jgi:hypothetical protein
MDVELERKTKKLGQQAYTAACKELAVKWVT